MRLLKCFLNSNLLSKRAPKFASNFLVETGGEEVDVDVELVAYNGSTRKKVLKSKSLSLTFVAGLKNTTILGTLSLGLRSSQSLESIRVTHYRHLYLGDKATFRDKGDKSRISYLLESNRATSRFLKSDY